jgi:hypothetical protein
VSVSLETKLYKQQNNAAAAAAAAGKLKSSESL